MKRPRSYTVSGHARDKQAKRLTLFRQIMRTPWAVEAACRQFIAGLPRHHDFAETPRGRARRSERRFVLRSKLEALS